MKTIKCNGSEALKGYDELRNYEKFIYEDCGEWFGIKINEEYATLINGEGNFILARKYKNCLSIGNAGVLEFRTFASASDYVERRA